MVYKHLLFFFVSLHISSSSNGVVLISCFTLYIKISAGGRERAKVFACGERANACACERANVPEPRDGVRAHKRMRGCVSVCDSAGACVRARSRGCSRVERPSSARRARVERASSARRARVERARVRPHERARARVRRFARARGWIDLLIYLFIVGQSNSYNMP